MKLMQGLKGIWLYLTPDEAQALYNILNRSWVLYHQDFITWADETFSSELEELLGRCENRTVWYEVFGVDELGKSMPLASFESLNAALEYMRLETGNDYPVLCIDKWIGDGLSAEPVCEYFNPKHECVL